MGERTGGGEGGEKNKIERTNLWVPVPLFLPVPPQRQRVAQHRPFAVHRRLAHDDPEGVTQQKARGEGGAGVQVGAEDLRRPRLQGQGRVAPAGGEQPGADVLRGQGVEAVVEKEDVPGGSLDRAAIERR